MMSARAVVDFTKDLLRPGQPASFSGPTHVLGKHLRVKSNDGVALGIAFQDTMHLLKMDRRDIQGSLGTSDRLCSA